MHGPINIKSPNNINEWQMGFNAAFKGLNPTQYHSWNYKRNHTLHSSHMVCLTTIENVKVYPVPNSNPLMCEKPYFSSTNCNFSLGVRHLHVTLANDGTITLSDRCCFSPCNYSTCLITLAVGMILLHTNQSRDSENTACVSKLARESQWLRHKIIWCAKIFSLNNAT
jgi:hypothetical protein